MSTHATNHNNYSFEVAEQSFNYRLITVEDPSPTGTQLALAAGYRSAENLVILQQLSNGELENIRPTETVDLSNRSARFLMIESDRCYILKINGLRAEWPCQVISGAQVRKLGDVPQSETLYLEQAEEPDQQVETLDMINLDNPGVESFISRKQVWLLDVQGEKFEFCTPEVRVRDALERANINLSVEWEIIFKVKDKPEQYPLLTDMLDLRSPGIERLLVFPKKVDNGESAKVLQRAFALLPIDEAFLNGLGLSWETTIETDGRRWLLIHQYVLPNGYTASETLLALEIPPTYPGAAIYGFFATPPLVLISGREIASTQLRGNIRGVEYHGWSRHRGAENPWNPQFDNVKTQMALVEAALYKEVA